ncbi:thiol reductant ABC exporter subunit CydC [Hoyosella sp. G463]|uniref:Thiol reductant ABC exporter subunit CydC n=1 Tax=Lolliginicoccus lacisalsi TaxID=2742202 RepID=A0A927JB59_9ACTN|nr:thiol reductant ABC exporter subunit CydC [Lolliginicoccus lacisalsi]MBD8505873.1 thiol reductant ABC exporter subunit CydC [Lolliginicoccus lacisalsi]
MKTQRRLDKPGRQRPQQGTDLRPNGNRPTWRDLRRGLALLDIPRDRTLLAILAATITLGSALALAAVSAWLIMRAFAMPPVLDLTVAVVAVRALGISRGVFRYLDRLATHDIALRGTVAARTTLYRRLATGNPRTALAARRGQLLARTGEDIDTLGETVVRVLIPVAVALLLALIAVGGLALISPLAAAILAIALLLSGTVAPALAARAATIREHAADTHRGEHRDATMAVLDHAAELRVTGQLRPALDRAARALRHTDTSIDRAATTTAVASATVPLAIAASVIGSLLIGLELYGNGAIALTSLGILVLLPLAAFEATSALPEAAIHALRARNASHRLLGLLDDAGTGDVAPVASSAPAEGLELRGIQHGWTTPLAPPLDATWPPGSRILGTGSSGTGKTTLLLTLTGLIPPLAGSMEPGWAGAREQSLFLAEDAHIFATTVRDNLLLARGDATDADLLAACEAVGLGEWLATLPDGLGTVLEGGEEALSGGQRRRLLLARAVLSPAPVLLLDEPSEHLDAASAVRVLDALLDRGSGLMDAQRTVIVASHLAPTVEPDEWVRLG